MRRALVALTIASGAGSAGADDARDGVTEREPGAPERATDDVRALATSRDVEPWLQLDPTIAILPAGVESFAAARDAKTTSLALGPKTRASLLGQSWSSVERDVIVAGERGLPGRGWRAGAELAHDFGVVQLRLSVAEGQVDGRYGRGRYRETSISLGKTHRFSRWVTGWVMLSAGRRTWIGEHPPPPGESDATQVMLSLGFTF